MTIKRGGEKKERKKHLYIPNELRSRPLRCTTLPIVCMILFIIYWFILCPLAYVGIKRRCYKKKCNYSDMWPRYFWLTALLVFIIILSIILCIWCKKSKKKITISDTNEKNNAVIYDKKENQKLLHESFDYDSLKRKDTIEIVNEKALPAKIIKQFDLGQPKSKESKNKQKEQPSKKQLNETKGEDTTVEKIDTMFPRCSVRRKDTTDLKKRPETLVLKSPNTPKDSQKRQSLQEVRPISPLTPREIFFYDLFRSAHLQSMDKTWKFIENERKHSSNNFNNPDKPEVKDFVLKQKRASNPSTPSSPEFFIANVASHNQPCTSEAFMYVDGGQTEKELKICYLDTDEEAFTP